MEGLFCDGKDIVHLKAKRSQAFILSRTAPFQSVCQIKKLSLDGVAGYLICFIALVG